MEILSVAEVEQVSGADMDGWGFAGAVLAVGGGLIAVATAPVWGAVGGVIAIAAVGANAMSHYA